MVQPEVAGGQTKSYLILENISTVPLRFGLQVVTSILAPTGIVVGSAVVQDIEVVSTLVTLMMGKIESI